MSDSFVRCQCVKIGDMINGDCSDTSVPGKPFAHLGCMRLAAHWTDSYPVAEFWFIWSDKLGLPEYPPVYITLGVMKRISAPVGAALGTAAACGIMVLVVLLWPTARDLNTECRKSCAPRFSRVVPDPAFPKPATGKVGPMRCQCY